MRRSKVLSLVVLAALLVLAAAPALAASGPAVKLVPPKLPKAFVGTVVYSEIEGPHYELVPCQGSYCLTMAYVLQGPFDFSRYVGKKVAAFGYVHNGPSVWGKPVLRVLAIFPARLPAKPIEPAPGPVVPFAAK